MLLCQQIPSLVSVCFLCVFSIEGLVKSAVGDVVDMFWNVILHDARTGITASSTSILETESAAHNKRCHFVCCSDAVSRREAAFITYF